MSWITDKLLGLRAVWFGGEQLPERGALEFAGAGVEVEDDPINKRTVITIAGGTELITDAAPTTLPQIGFRANGRPQVWAVPQDGGAEDAYDIALLHDVQLFGGVNKPADAGAMSTYWAVLTPPMSKPHELLFAFFIPSVNVVANATDYATITISSISSFGETPTLLATTTTQDGFTETSPILIELSSTTIASGYVYVDISKSGAGVALPAMYIGVKATPITTYSP